MANSSFGGTVDYSDDPLLPPWYIPGWSSQLQNNPSFALPAPKNPFFNFSNLPTDLNFVEVIGNYMDSMGNNLGGFLTFEQSENLLYGPDPITGLMYRMPKRLVGIIPNKNQNFIAWNAEGSGKTYLIFGMLDVLLMATDTPNIQILESYNETQETGFVAPTSWVYHVKEYFYGGMRYDISVPTADDTATTDINSLIIPSTYQKNHDWNRGF